MKIQISTQYYIISYPTILSIQRASEEANHGLTNTIPGDGDGDGDDAEGVCNLIHQILQCTFATGAYYFDDGRIRQQHF